MPELIEITDLSLPELDVYAGQTETQLLHYYEPDEGIFIAESPRVIKRALDKGYTPLSFLLERGQVKGQVKEILACFENIPVYVAEPEILTGLTGFAMTRGALCAMRRQTLPKAREICTGARRIAVLENVMNPTNVGAIFRSAAALNMDAVLLTPGCSDPLYRRAIRVSMGTVFQIPWTFLGSRADEWPQQGMKLLREMGFRTAAMALKEDSVSIRYPRLAEEERLAIVLGTEGEGLAEDTIADCDYTVRIPMSHGVNSLNVAAASAVAFWQLGGQEA